MPLPIHEHETTIRANLKAMEWAGLSMTWRPPAGEGEVHVFTARTPEGETFSVRGDNPLVALAELMRQLEFEDLD